MRRTVAPALLALSLSLGLPLLTACGGSDGSDGPGGATGSPTDGSTSSSPSADPATGLTLSLAHSTVAVPEEWKRMRQVVRGKVAAQSPDFLSFISLGEIEAFGSPAGVDELGRYRIQSEVSPRKPELLAPTTLDDVPVYHVAGFVSDREYLEEFGAIRDDRIVTLTFSFDKRVPEQERQQVVDQVLPTFHWR